MCRFGEESLSSPWGQVFCVDRDSRRWPRRPGLRCRAVRSRDRRAASRSSGHPSTTRHAAALDKAERGIAEEQNGGTPVCSRPRGTLR